MFSFLSFSISLVLIVALLGVKIQEIRVGREGVLSRASRRLDPVLERFFEAAEEAGFAALRVLYKFVFVTLRRILRAELERLGETLRRMVDFFIHKFRGKTKRRRTAPSFFWKDVSEHKRRIVRG